MPPCPMGVFDLRHPHVVTKGKGKGRSRCVSLRFDFRGPDPDPAVGRQHCEGERESGDDLLCRWARPLVLRFDVPRSSFFFLLFLYSLFLSFSGLFQCGRSRILFSSSYVLFYSNNSKNEE